MARRSEAVAGSVLQTADASIPKTIIRFRQDKGCDSVLGLGCKAQREIVSCPNGRWLGQGRQTVALPRDSWQK